MSKKNKMILEIGLFGVVSTFFLPSIHGQDVIVGAKERTVTIVEDRAQKYMVSKLYELKNIKAADLAPFVLGAIRRYVPGSPSEPSVEALSYKKEGKEYLLVNMATEMVPDIDDMIAKLDRPSKSDSEGSIVDGDGIYRFVYAPKHRFTSDMMRVASIVSGGDGRFFVDPGTNTFYWKDSKSDGALVQQWLEAFDKPAPQVTLTFKVYEFSDNDFKELGIDFIAWKNGPGAELAGFGADFFDFRSKEEIFANALEMFSGFGNSWSGMIFAPQFDASFLRILAQKGKARISHSAFLTVSNDLAGVYRISLDPQLQNINKTDLMELSVGPGSSGLFDLTVTGPIIAYNDDANKAVVVMFNYFIDMFDSIERNNTGTEFVNHNTVTSNITLAEGVEKMLGSFSKVHDVEQYNGMVFMSKVPILKYLFGTTTHSKSFIRFFVTVKADSAVGVVPMSEFAGEIIDASQLIISGAKTEVKEKT
ncbi:MAG TPA: hypothetical protein P5239_10305, partial [Victivallales bacterium]|nr:hypothetical protein [Victivallales bacterium]